MNVGYDGGVDLMRHMECFMGEQDGDWECGIDIDSSTRRKQILILRKMYIAKMILSQHNEHRKKLTAETNRYATEKKKNYLAMKQKTRK